MNSTTGWKRRDSPDERKEPTDDQLYIDAEFDEPSKLLFVAKLANPMLSLGIRKKIIVTKKRLIRNPNNFNILLKHFLHLVCEQIFKAINE